MQGRVSVSLNVTAGFGRFFLDSSNQRMAFWISHQWSNVGIDGFGCRKTTALRTNFVVADQTWTEWTSRRICVWFEKRSYVVRNTQVVFCWWFFSFFFSEVVFAQNGFYAPRTYFRVSLKFEECILQTEPWQWQLLKETTLVDGFGWMWTCRWMVDFWYFGKICVWLTCFWKGCFRATWHWIRGTWGIDYFESHPQWESELYFEPTNDSPRFLGGQYFVVSPCRNEISPSMYHTQYHTKHWHIRREMCTHFIQMRPTHRTAADGQLDQHSNLLAMDIPVVDGQNSLPFGMNHTLYIPIHHGIFSLNWCRIWFPNIWSVVLQHAKWFYQLIYIYICIFIKYIYIYMKHQRIHELVKSSVQLTDSTCSFTCGSCVLFFCWLFFFVLPAWKGGRAVVVWSNLSHVLIFGSRNWPGQRRNFFFHCDRRNRELEDTV